MRSRLWLGVLGFAALVATGCGGGSSSSSDLRTNPELVPLRDLLASAKQTKIAHNAKFDAKWVRHHLGAEVGGIYDTYLASLLIAAGEGERRQRKRYRQRHETGQTCSVKVSCETRSSRPTLNLAGQTSRVSERRKSRKRERKA